MALGTPFAATIALLFAGMIQGCFLHPGTARPTSSPSAHLPRAEPHQETRELGLPPSPWRTAGETAFPQGGPTLALQTLTSPALQDLIVPAPLQPAPAKEKVRARKKLSLAIPPNTREEIAQTIHRLWPTIEAHARKHDLDPRLVLAVIWVESRYNPHAESMAGASGLMQLMPKTAASLAKRLDAQTRPIQDPEFNISLGCYFLRRLLNRLDGRLDHALAAYNAGAGRVRRWQREGRSFPAQVQGYIDAVHEARGFFRISGA